MPSISDRLASLRAQMRKEGVTHLLIPSSDEHLNECVPPWHERRRWASGFTGSAGDVLVGLEPDETWLFTDSRYHLQAETELTGCGIGLQKVGAPGGKTLLEILAELAGRHGSSCRVGCDPMTLCATTAEEFEKTLGAGGAELVGLSPNPVDRLWAERPAPATTRLKPCPVGWSSRDPSRKLHQVREALAKANASALVAAKLDQIAWLLNLRGDDIPYNPVFESYLVVAADGAHLFVRAPETRLPDGAPEGFTLHEYEEFAAFLATGITGPTVHLDPDAVAWGVTAALAKTPVIQVLRGPNPIDILKAEKDDKERACMTRASLEASAAKVRTLLWLNRHIRDGNTVTEQQFADRLEAFDKELEGFEGLSFPTIAATGAHGAIVHYGAADDTPLIRGDLFLVDSGIHLGGGTTDDTRTVAVGTPSEEHRRVFTAVLKGHIAGASLVFPEKTPGAAVDAICRKPLWEAGLDYGHGTGHGVGAFLHVHEGPFALAPASRRPPSTRPLEAGMVTSIEPGCYMKGSGGVRLENLYLVVETGGEIGGRKALGFEPLTWIPFDPALTDRDRLTETEMAWLDRYHRECIERLTPRLSSGDAQRLRKLVVAH